MRLTYDVSKKITTTFSLESFYQNRISDNNSYFRFKTRENNTTFKLEYFHLKGEENEDDIECILNVYKGPNKISAHYGTFEHLLETINKNK